MELDPQGLEAVVGAEALGRLQQHTLHLVLDPNPIRAVGCGVHALWSSTRRNWKRSSVQRRLDAFSSNGAFHAFTSGNLASATGTCAQLPGSFEAASWQLPDGLKPPNVANFTHTPPDSAHSRTPSPSVCTHPVEDFCVRREPAGRRRV